MNKRFLILPALALSACAAPMARTAPAAASVEEISSSTASAHAGLDRRERMKRILSHNVRLFMYDGDEARKTASGVVVGSEVTSTGTVSYVLTNAHALDTTGMKAPELRVVVDRPWEDASAEPMEFLGRPIAVGSVPEMDLALVQVRGVRLEPVEIAETSELVPGDSVVVAAAPFGRMISLSGGLVSAVEYDRKTRAPTMMKTDAAIGYGASGGGVYSVDTGKLLAIVEGYRTAKVGFAVQEEKFSFDVPMPGETFAAPASKVRAFLEQKGFAHLIDGASEAARTASR